MAKSPKNEPDPRVTKRRVTMTSAVVTREGDKLVSRQLQAVDYVRPDVLDAYVADAKTRWDDVSVAGEPDAGPAGYDGATYIPPNLNHPLAHSYFPATDCKDCDHAPEFDGRKARIVRPEKES